MPDSKKYFHMLEMPVPPGGTSYVNTTVCTGDIRNIAITADNSQVYAAGNNANTLIKINVSNNAVATTINTARKAFCLAIDASNTAWVGNAPTSGAASQGYVTKVNTSNTVTSIPFLDSLTQYASPRSLTITDDSVWIVGFSENGLYRINPTDNSITGSYGIVGGSPVSIVASDQYLWTANSSGTRAPSISQCNLSGNLLRDIGLGASPICLALNPDKSKVYVVDRFGFIYSMDISGTGGVFIQITQIPGGNSQGGLVITPDYIFAGGNTGNIYKILISDVSQVQILSNGSSSPVFSIVTNSDYTSIWAAIQGEVVRFTEFVPPPPPSPNEAANEALQADNQVAASNATAGVAVKAGVPLTLAAAVSANLQQTGIPNARNTYVEKNTPTPPRSIIPGVPITP